MRSSVVQWLAGIVVTVVISAVPSEAAEWTVDPSPEVGAFSTIWEAVLFAAPGDVVRVNPGTYCESVEILTSIRLVGSMDGVAEIVPTERFAVKLHGGASGAVLENLAIRGTSRLSQGVVVSEVNSVTVDGLKIIGCDEGIRIEDASSVAVRNCSVSGNANGVVLRNSSDCAIVGNTCTDNVFGIALDHAEGNRIVENALRGNFEGVSVWTGSTGNTIEGNRAEENATGISVNAARNRIVGNTLLVNANGISLWASTSCWIEGNAAAGNGTGINVSESDEVTMTGNDCSGNEQNGINLHACTGCAVEGNVASGNWSCGIQFGHCEDTAASGNVCEENRYAGMQLWNSTGCDVLGNRLAANRFAGLILSGFTSGTTVEENVVEGNGRHSTVDWIG